MAKSVINVSISSETLAAINEKVTKGIYTSRSHAVDCLLSVGLGKDDPPPIPVRGRPLSAEQRKTERTNSVIDKFLDKMWVLLERPGDIIDTETGLPPGDTKTIKALGLEDYSWYTKNRPLIHLLWGSRLGHSKGPWKSRAEQEREMFEQMAKEEEA